MSLLLQHCERTLDPPAYPKLVSCCPTMDLVAISTEDQQVHVFRFNGHHAFELPKGASNRKIQSIQWKFDGQALAVGWDDGTVDVISAESGKILQHVKHVTTSGAATSAAPSKSPVIAISWANAVINPQRKAATNSGSRHLKWPRPDNLPDADKALSLIPDLPSYLSSLDPESLLPRLPPIPAANASANSAINPEVFAQQSTLDSLFQSANSREPGSVDILTIHQQDTTASRIVLADSLNIGDLPFPDNWTTNRFGSLSGMNHASHPSSHSRVLLPTFSRADSPDSALVFAPLSFSFIAPAGDRLSAVTAKTTQMQNLLHYIHRAIEGSSHVWKSAEELPTKLIDNATEALASEKSGSFVAALHHHVLTGQCPPALKEWLVDQLGERGQKRWEHAMEHGYQKIFEAFHQSLLPAMDRLCILVSALRGLATHFSDNPVLQVSISDFNRVLEHTRALRFHIHSVLLVTTSEREQFAAFSKWLQHAVDRQSPNSQRDPKKDPEVDYARLLAYLNGPLIGSRLSILLAHMTEKELENIEPISCETIKNRIDEFSNSKSADGFRSKWRGGAIKQASQELIPSLSIWPLLKQLLGSCKELAEKITALQLQKTQLPFALTLETKGKIALVDSRMVETEPAKSSNDSRMATYVAVVKENERHRVQFHRILHKPLMTVKEDVDKCDAFYLELTSTTVLDVKFVSDREVLLLVKQDKKDEPPQPDKSKEEEYDDPSTYSLLSFPYATEGLDLSSLSSLSLSATTTIPPSALGQYYYTRSTPEVHTHIEFPSGEADLDMMERAEWVIPADEVRNYSRHQFGRRPFGLSVKRPAAPNSDPKMAGNGVNPIGSNIPPIEDPSSPSSSITIRPGGVGPLPEGPAVEAELDDFVPCRFDVNGRPDRRFICVVGQNGGRYRVLDLDRLESEISDAAIPIGEPATELFANVKVTSTPVGGITAARMEEERRRREDDVEMDR